jgi:hypothetical protein
MDESRLKGEPFYVEEVSGEALAEHYKKMFSLPDFKAIADEQLKGDFTLPASQINHVFNFNHGNLIFISGEPLPGALDTFKRLTKVFEQTYTRFLDLQKAEAQAREARIETALEKIRSRSLGMHQSVEIKEVVSILFEKLKELELVFDGGAAIHLFPEGSRNATIWVVSPDLGKPSCIDLPYDENAFENNPIIKDVWNAKETGVHIYNKFYSFEEKNRYFNYVFKHNDLITIPTTAREFILEADSYTASFIAEKNSMLGANSWTRQLFSDNDLDVLKRIGRVFEQAYIRFLDLQKAEVQAREAQIELSLERVRAKTMAMHNSEDVADIVTVMFDELIHLGIEKNARCGIGILDDNDMKMEVWTAFSRSNENVGLTIGTLDMELHTMLQQVYHSWKNNSTHSTYTLTGEDQKIYYRAINNMKDYPAKFDLESLPVVQYQNAFYFKEGIIYVFTLEQLTNKTTDIIKRFAKVFGQTYTRYLDLQRAEAQAREAQIEAALEKVRGKTMAMHMSTELQNVIMEMANQLEHLGFKFDSVNIDVNLEIHKDPNMHLWISVSGKQPYPTKIIIPYFDHPIFTKSYEKLDKGETFFADTFSREEKDTFFDYIFKCTILKYMPDERKQYIYNGEGMARSIAIAKHTALAVYNYDLNTYSAEENSILVRFSYVFDQAYTRFLDLQKAEAQAREAKIEVALERTRTQSMIMQHSNELDGALRVFHEQVLSLDIPSAFSFLWLPDEINDRHIFWAAWAENVSATALTDHNATVFKSKAINYLLDRNEPATKQCLICIMWKPL